MTDGSKTLKVIERLAHRAGCYIEMDESDIINDTINALEKWMDENPEWEGVKEENNG